MAENKVNTTPEETQERVQNARRNAAKGRKAIAKKAQALQRLSVEYVPIDAVHPNEYNPNRQSDHDFELLLRSIEEDGFTQPVIVNQDMIIVDGEHRWRAAHSLGLTEIPVVKTEMTVEQMRISTLRHNRARGSHDIELEASVLRDLQELGALDWAQDSLMLDDLEMNRLLEDIAVPETFAGEEFNEAWVPAKNSGQENAHLTVDARANTMGDGGVEISATSYQALELQRQREKALAAAKTEADRQKAKEESKVFRLVLVYAGDEAKIVSSVLGDKPAEKLVELCKAAI